MKTARLALLAFTGYCLSTGAFAETAALRQLEARWTQVVPQVDGDGSDAVWQQAPALVVNDVVAGIPIELRALYDAGRVYIRASYPDKDESRSHKAFVWDEREGRYRTGPSREDALVLKWAMDADTEDLTLHAEQAYRADIWYWKANRTDPAGHADDKIQLYSRGKVPQSKALWSRHGLPFYLRRTGDEGLSAYESLAYAEFQGKVMPKFRSRVPEGSRADILARGQWQDGRWTIEFSRALDTRHGDDVLLVPGNLHLFGVSRYEIAGRGRDEEADQPDFGSGEVGEHLFLSFLPH